MNDYLPPRLLQIFGGLLLVASFVASIIFGRDVALFVGAAMTLLLLGGYRSALEEARARRIQPGDDSEPS